MYLKIKYFDYLNRSCIFFLMFFVLFSKIQIGRLLKEGKKSKMMMIDDNVSNINECEKTVLENWDCQKQCDK